MNESRHDDQIEGKGAAHPWFRSHPDGERWSSNLALVVCWCMTCASCVLQSTAGEQAITQLVMARTAHRCHGVMVFPCGQVWGERVTGDGCDWTDPSPTEAMCGDRLVVPAQRGWCQWSPVYTGLSLPGRTPTYPGGPPRSRPSPHWQISSHTTAHYATKYNLHQIANSSI